MFLRRKACLCLNASMLTEERRQLILERLSRDGKVVAAELSASLAVSPDTVRRDLQAPAAKAAIARATARLLHDGQVILLDAGTTTLEVARHLPAELRATVITNSPPIAVALAEHPTVAVTVLGGTLEKDARALVGAATIEALRSLRADV